MTTIAFVLRSFALCLVVLNVAAAPNIVFILADDLGIYDLHCYGRKDHNTPNLDRLAGEGILFTRAYCAQPICSPSRAAIMTGKAPARLHLTTYLPGRADAPSQKLLHPKMRQELPLAERTVAELLKPAGYKSALIGKWHLGGRGYLPTDQGFDLYYPGKPNTEPSASEGGKGEYDLTAKAEEFIKANHTNAFLLFLAHNSPHINYSAKGELIEKNKGAFEPVYAAVIETLDDSVGRLLRTLDELKLRENTMVVFTSDNGGLHVPEGKHPKITYNTPFRAGKGFLYEGGMRIPLIVRWPGKIEAGKKIEETVINTDWLPTFLEFAGVNTPEALDGISIAGLLRGTASAPNRNLYWHFPHYTNQGSRPGGAIMAGPWKLIEHYEDGDVELFNLRTDPSETRNLAAMEKARVESMKAELDQWRKAMQVQLNQPNPKFKPEQHKPIYEDFDASHFKPEESADLTGVLQWRRLMNAALR